MSAVLRFGVSVPGAADGRSWRQLARRVESAGFDKIVVPDHLSPRLLSATHAVMSALDSTTSLRGATMVLNNARRHPVVVAREAATIALLSDGRFELGLGAGYGDSAATDAGMTHPPVGVRIEQLDESTQLIRELCAGEPVHFEGRHYSAANTECAVLQGTGIRVPILVGGNSGGVLAVAARHADAVGFIGVSPSSTPDGRLRPTNITHAGLRRQLDFVRSVAGERFGGLGRSILVQEVALGPDRRAAAAAIGRWLPATAEEILDSPYFLLGTIDAIVDQLHRLRDEFGVGEVTVLGSSLVATEQVLARFT